MVIKTETEVKQVVGKRRNKKRYTVYIPCRCPCPVESHGRVDGLDWCHANTKLTGRAAGSKIRKNAEDKSTGETKQQKL